MQDEIDVNDQGVESKVEGENTAMESKSQSIQQESRIWVFVLLFVYDHPCMFGSVLGEACSIL